MVVVRNNSESWVWARGSVPGLQIAAAHAVFVDSGLNVAAEHASAECQGSCSVAVTPLLAQRRACTASQLDQHWQQQSYQPGLVEAPAYQHAVQLPGSLQAESVAHKSAACCI